MTTPWFDPQLFGALYGGIIGGVFLGAGGGTLGSLAGRWAPRAKNRRWIIGGMHAFLAFGVIQVVVGLIALLSGQPYGIWYPLLLCGGVSTLVMGLQLPRIRRAYAAAENRRVQAEAFRNM
jgi:MFS family permease